MRKFDRGLHCSLTLVEGDITKLACDAMVNAANESLLGGGGVDGAIHDGAGPQLVEACRAIPEVRPGIRCLPGQARITPGFNLPCKYIIHAVGPIYESPAVSAPILASTYRAALDLANQNGVQSIAFPAISCGAYGYPTAEAANVAAHTCWHSCGELTEMKFVLFGSEDFRVWEAIIENFFC